MDKKEKKESIDWGELVSKKEHLVSRITTLREEMGAAMEQLSEIDNQIGEGVLKTTGITIKEGDYVLLFTDNRSNDTPNVKDTLEIIKVDSASIESSQNIAIKGNRIYMYVNQGKKEHKMFNVDTAPLNMEWKTKEGDGSIDIEINPDTIESLTVYTNDSFHLPISELTGEKKGKYAAIADQATIKIIMNHVIDFIGFSMRQSSCPTIPLFPYRKK